MHRRPTPENLLFDESRRIHIGHFGFSRSSSETYALTHGAGDLVYSAPEMQDPNFEYTTNVDVYAFSIIARQIMFGESHRKPIPPGVSPRLRNLLESGFSRNPQDRPSFDDICKEFQRKKFTIFGMKPLESGALDEYVAWLDTPVQRSPL
jgi:serine/threonine protein kinase